MSWVDVKEEWVSIKDKLPEHNQHVLVWDDRDNVYSWSAGDPLADDNAGRRRMGDAIFEDSKAEWRADQHFASFEAFIEINGPRYRWKGHGPCSFSEVTHWMPMPEPPADTIDLDDRYE